MKFFSNETKMGQKCAFFTERDQNMTKNLEAFSSKLFWTFNFISPYSANIGPLKLVLVSLEKEFYLLYHLTHNSILQNLTTMSLFLETASYFDLKNAANLISCTINCITHFCRRRHYTTWKVLVSFEMRFFIRFYVQFYKGIF